MWDENHSTAQETYMNNIWYKKNRKQNNWTFDALYVMLIKIKSPQTSPSNVTFLQ